MYEFAALRFIEDENISDRVYWYLSELDLQAGDLVLAPVGAHNRLQLARVERAYRGEEEDAPIDVRFLKRTEARYQHRKLIVGETPCYELGGVRYDVKRYTRFRQILFTDSQDAEAMKEELARYGVTETVSSDGEDALRRLAECEGCALLYGKRAAEIAKAVLSCVRGEENLNQETAAKLRRKLR